MATCGDYTLRQDIIALGWQYLALYILGTESLGRNWARDHFPAPPPNAKTLGLTARGVWMVVGWLVWLFLSGFWPLATRCIGRQYSKIMRHPLLKNHGSSLTVYSMVFQWQAHHPKVVSGLRNTQRLQLEYLQLKDLKE